MDRQALKAFGYFMAANFQAVVLIGIAFKLVPYLDEHHAIFFPWAYLIWPVCVFIIGHSYYLMSRQLMNIDTQRKK